MNKTYNLPETKQAKMIREFSAEVYSVMGWEDLLITRFKVATTKQWRGYSMVLSNDAAIIIISNDSEINRSEKEYWHTVIHELIHIYLYRQGFSLDKAFGHGKAFKKVCKEIEIKSEGKFTYKGLTR